MLWLQQLLPYNSHIYIYIYLYLHVYTGSLVRVQYRCNFSIGGLLFANLYYLVFLFSLGQEALGPLDLGSEPLAHMIPMGDFRAAHIGLLSVTRILKPSGP